MLMVIGHGHIKMVGIRGLVGGDNPRQNQNQQNRSVQPNRKQNDRQGNANQVIQGSGFRLK